MSQMDLLVILGATATGKTRLAVELARRCGGEIISADSRQVFRGMDIGSGKDLHEYGPVPYHLIDICDAGTEFSVFNFQHCFFKVFDELTQRGKLPVLCGGSGLYLDAVLRGYRMVEAPRDDQLRARLEEYSQEQLLAELRQLRPQQHNDTDLLDRERTVRAIEIATAELRQNTPEAPFPVQRPLVIGIRWPREELRRRITSRLQERLSGGMIEEVSRLNEQGIPWQRLDYYGLEYRYVGAFIRGELSRNDMFQRLNSAIHDFAKRQETWFRRMERLGVVIHWVDGGPQSLEQAWNLVSSSLLDDEGCMS